MRREVPLDPLLKKWEAAVLPFIIGELEVIFLMWDVFHPEGTFRIGHAKG
jgi:hypothetical protein